MSVTINVALIKQTLLPELVDTTDDDAVIQEILDNVTNQVVSYLDDSSITGRATIPSDCEWPMMKQIAYEYRRRKDPGLSSVTFPDGTVNKYGDGEFLDGFVEVLDRARKIHIGG
jgi:hypothetical protein